jgi:hypothetical protein
MEKRDEKHAKHEKPPTPRKQRMLDEALEDSFPASDPPAQTTPGIGPAIDAEKLVKSAKAARKDEQDAKKH